MNEIEYLNWLIADAVKQHPELKWFMSHVSDSLNELTVNDIKCCYTHNFTDWEILKLCSYQSVDLNIEHHHLFIESVFKLLANEQTRH